MDVIQSYINVFLFDLNKSYSLIITTHLYQFQTNIKEASINSYIQYFRFPLLTLPRCLSRGN